MSHAQHMYINYRFLRNRMIPTDVSNIISCVLDDAEITFLVDVKRPCTSGNIHYYSCMHKISNLDEREFNYNIIIYVCEQGREKWSSCNVTHSWIPQLPWLRSIIFLHFAAIRIHAVAKLKEYLTRTQSSNPSRICFLFQFSYIPNSLWTCSCAVKI